MEQERSAPRFIADPVGKYLVRRSWIAWCAAPDLIGATFHGVPAAVDAVELFQLWQMQTGRAARDVITDFSRVRGVDQAAFLAAARYLRVNRQSRCIRRQLILLPADPIAGSLIAGLPVHVQCRHSWRAVRSLSEGTAWLQRTEAARSCRLIEGIIAEIEASNAALAEVRALLASHPDHDIAAVAKRMARSPRTLQRELAEARSSFRELSRAARMQAAARLLAETTLKIEVVGRQIGYRSVSHFGYVFRAAIGMSPLQYRRARRPNASES